MVVMEEMKALQENGTWEMVELPEGKKDWWKQVGVYSEV